MGVAQWEADEQNAQLNYSNRFKDVDMQQFNKKVLRLMDLWEYLYFG